MYVNTNYIYDSVNQLHLAPGDIKKKHIVPQYSVSIPRDLLNKTDKYAGTMGINSLPIPNVWSRRDPSINFYISLYTVGKLRVSLISHSIIRCSKMYFHDKDSIVITVRSMMVYGNLQVKSAGT